MRVAVEMRERGHTYVEIARAVRCGPMLASMLVLEGSDLQVWHRDVRHDRGIVPQYRGHRPTEELAA
jgi:hypothetical protein